MFTFPFSLHKKWTPAQMPTSLWLDASDASTITIATGVSSWRDKSGNGRNVTQGTAGAQPARITNFSNGLHALSFDGGDSLIWSGASTSFSGIQLAFIGRQQASGSLYSAFFKLSGATDQFNIREDSYTPTTNMQVEFNTGSGLKYSGTSKPSSFNTIFICSMSYNGSVVYLYVDGQNSAYTSSTTGTMDINNINIGAPSQFIGNIGELVIVNSTNGNIRLMLEGYLAWKWGLLSNLPALHPYKNIAP